MSLDCDSIPGSILVYWVDYNGDAHERLFVTLTAAKNFVDSMRH